MNGGEPLPDRGWNALIRLIESLIDRAIPKSVIFTRPVAETMMFAGFKSRWTILASRCAYSSASHT